MPLKLSDDQARRLRLRCQRLAPTRRRPTHGVAGVVREVCGIQAQDPAAAALGIRARAPGIRLSDVERAIAERRSIVRTWCLRGTLHLVASEDVGWLLGLLGPLFIRSNRGRRAQLGLDEATEQRAIRALRRVLRRSGPQTRAEIVEKLAGQSIQLKGQARPHLLALASLQGLICNGPPRGREPTYVLLADWIDPGPTLARGAALARLAERHLAAYAPATPEDLAAWSGLSLAEARSGWQSISAQLIEVVRGRSTAWILKTQRKGLERVVAPRPLVRLLPAYDTYLLGTRDRDLVLSASDVKRLFPGGGLLYPAVLLDGRVVGRWRVQRRRAVIDVVVEPFERLPREAVGALKIEAEDVGRFLGLEPSLKIIK
jgi:hypothetical protein